MTTQILAFGVVHMISCAIIYLIVGYGSEAILKTRPQAAQLVGRFFRWFDGHYRNVLIDWANLKVIQQKLLASISGQ